MAGWTGIAPVTFGLTSRCSSWLSYQPEGRKDEG